MLRKFGFMMMVLMMVTAWAGMALAACESLSEVRGQKKWGTAHPEGHVYVCIADGANTIADLVIADTTGHLQAVDTVFKSPAPTSITPVLKTVDGITAFTGTAVTNAASGRNRPDVPEGFPGGLTISQTGTFDAGDVWWLVLVFL